jgi:predicted nucleic acid-binding protein
MKYLIDTNVLLRAAQKDHPMHSRAGSAMNGLRYTGEELCIIPQNLIEFWAVATQPLASNGLGLTIAEAVQEKSQIKTLFTLYLDTPGIFAEWEYLTTKYQVQGKQVHDARIVAAMNTHDIKTILTFNVDDLNDMTK